MDTDLVAVDTSYVEVADEVDQTGLQDKVVVVWVDVADDDEGEMVVYAVEDVVG